MGGLTGVGHDHLDEGSFQMLLGDQWLTKETPAYTGNITGYNGVGTEWAGSTVGHNGLLFDGQGLADEYANGPPVVTRLESQPAYTFASVDLTPAYRTTLNPYAGAHDNPYVNSVVRDFVYVPALDTLLVFDRTEGSSDKIAASTVDKTFLLHFPNAPTQQGTNTWLGVNGDQALQLTVLTPQGQSAATFKVVNELPGTPDGTTDYQYRLEETTTGQAQSYLINVLQARSVNGSNVSATMTEDASGFTITLADPTRGTAVIRLSKGMASSGGSFAFSPSGTPTASTSLTSKVQGIRVTQNGVIWAGSWTQTTSADFNAGSLSGVTVTAQGDGALQLSSSATVGTFTSAVFDVGQIVDWQKVNWTATAPSGTTVKVEVSVSNDNSTWSNWTTATNGTSLSGVSGRYIRYRVTLTSADSSVTPVFQDITFNYI
jgi:hypothetical protein